MNLNYLKWIKVVTPSQEWKHHWALSPDEVEDPERDDQIIHHNGLTIVPLGFKHTGAEKLQSGDLMLLTQRAKITHIVEILDNQPYKRDDWFYRYIKIVWWKPDIDWNELPHRKTVLGFDIPIQKGIPYELTSFQAFHERWDAQGGLEAFRVQLTQQIT